MLRAVIDKRSTDDAFPRAAQLVTYATQGVEFLNCPIEIDAIFGEESIVDAAGFGFLLKFRRCTLHLYLTRCEISHSINRYQKTLSDQDFLYLINKTITSQNNRGVKVGISTDKLISRLFGAIGIEVSGSANIQKIVEKMNDEKQEIKIRYKIVEPIAGNCWRIGHELIGDPRSLDQNLSGQYFRTPSDDSDQSSEFATALCGIQPSGSNRTYEVAVELRTRFRDCSYYQIDETKPEGDDWRTKNKEKIEKLFQLRVIRNDQVKTGFTMPEEEIIISRGMLRIRCDEDGHEGAGSE